MQWLNDSVQLTTTQQLTHSLLVGWGRESEEQKWEHLWAEIKTACKQSKKNKFSSLLHISRQVFSYFHECRALSYITVAWEVKCHNWRFPLPPFLFPAFISRSIIIWHRISLWSVRVSCPSCVSPNFWESPACSLSGQCEKQKKPWHWVSTVPQQLKHQHAISALFITNPKHSPIPATRKKFNSISAKTSVQYYGDHVEDSQYYLDNLASGNIFFKGRNIPECSRCQCINEQARKIWTPPWFYI